MTSNDDEEVKAVCMKLIQEATIEKVYNKEKGVFIFEIVFPKWFKETYEPETVASLVKLITPVIQDELRKTINNKHIGTFIEGI